MISKNFQEFCEYVDSKYSNNNSVIDLNSGNLKRIKMLERRGFKNTTAYNPTIQKMSKPLDIVSDDEKKLPTASIVIAPDIIEYVPYKQVDDVIDKLCGMVKNKGILFLSVLSYDSDIIHYGEGANTREAFKEDKKITVVQAYGLRNMELRFEKNGFYVRKRENVEAEGYVNYSALRKQYPKYKKTYFWVVRDKLV